MLQQIKALKTPEKAMLAGAGLVAVLMGVRYLSPQGVVWSDAQASADRGAHAPPAAPELRGMMAVDAGPASPAPALPPAPPVQVAHGVVQSEDEAVIASRMTALITALPLDAGQSFGRGQLLARFDCSQMQAQLAAADAASAAYQKTYDTNVELDRYKAIGTNEVGVSKANLGKAQAEAQAIRAGTDQCAIFAPFAGKVVERIAHPHDVAASGQPLMKIQGAGDLKVEMIVPSNWLTWLQPGAPFDFALEETGAVVHGHVARLGAAVDPVSKTLRVTGDLQSTQGVLPGMSGAARFSRSAA